jgi:hypothetical protein
MLFALAGCEGPVGPAGTPGLDGQNGADGQNGTDGENGVDGVSPELPEDPDDPEDPDTPVEGPEGPAGPTGPAGDVYLTGAVSAEDLIVAFASATNVVLQSTAPSVYGEVPATKTLTVVGNTTTVPATQTLNVEGTLRIWGGGILTATGEGSSGFITVGAEGSITGDGMIALPFDSTADEAYGGVKYQTPGITATKIAGSVVTGLPDTIVGIFPATIATLFTNTSELTLIDVVGLPPGAIPVGKKLTLVGKDNTITSTVGISVDAELVIAKDAELTIDMPGVSLNTSGAGKVTNLGTINLSGTSYVQSSGGNGFQNNGVIAFTMDAGTTRATLEPLLALQGSGSTRLIVPAPPTGVTTSLTITESLKVGHNLVIGDYVTFGLNPNSSFSPLEIGEGKKVRIETNGVLSLGADAAGLKADSVDNRGTISVAVTSAKVLQNIFKAMGSNGGKVISTGVVVMPAADPEPDFVVPERVDLTLAGSPTFADTRDFIVEIGGSAAITAGGSINATRDIKVAGTFSKVGGGNIIATRYLTVSGGVTIQGNGAITVTEEDFEVSGTFSKAGNGVITVTAGDFTVSGTFTKNGAGAITVGGDVTVTPTGNFNAPTGNGSISSTGAFTVGGTFNNSGNAPLTAGGLLTVNGTLNNTGTGNLTAAGGLTVGPVGVLNNGGTGTIFAGVAGQSTNVNISGTLNTGAAGDFTISTPAAFTALGSSTLTVSVPDKISGAAVIAPEAAAGINLTIGTKEGYRLTDTTGIPANNLKTAVAALDDMSGKFVDTYAFDGNSSKKVIGTVEILSNASAPSAQNPQSIKCSGDFSGSTYLGFDTVLGIRTGTGTGLGDELEDHAGITGEVFEVRVPAGGIRRAQVTDIDYAGSTLVRSRVVFCNVKLTYTDGSIIMTPELDLFHIGILSKRS